MNSAPPVATSHRFLLKLAGTGGTIAPTETITVAGLGIFPHWRQPIKTRYALLGLAALLLGLEGCVSQNQMLDNAQAQAVQTAVGRGRFDMQCPAATGVVISREVVQPALQGGFVQGIQRAEFTVGVEGCNRRKSYIVVCPEGGNGCFATAPGPFHQDWQ